MNERLGVSLKEAREQRGLDQQELATLLGIGKVAVSKLETGSRQLTVGEFLTAGLIFGDWFEMQANDLVDVLTADLVMRLEAHLHKAEFAPTEFGKREWYGELLNRLNHEYSVTA